MMKLDADEKPVSCEFIGCDGNVAPYIISSTTNIKSLEQESSEDCISRQAAIDAVRKNTFRLTFAEEQGCKGHVAWSAEAVYSDAIKGALLELPPVIPQPKMGRWIDDKCSVCGKGTEDLISSSEWYRNEEPNFCPFCGLRLIEPQESEET